MIQDSLEKMGKRFGELANSLSQRAPLFGVFAFSACSVHALAHMLLKYARHDTPLFWGASAMIELATAWLATRIVEQVREATRSVGGRYGTTKQNRRFAIFALIVYSSLAAPSFATSVVANYMEFSDNGLLAFLFPVLTIACAVGAAMPGIISARKQKEKAEEEQSKRDDAAQKAEEEQSRAAKAAQKAIQEAEESAKKREKTAQTLEDLGRTTDFLRQLVADPAQSRADLAQTLDVAPQTVSYHLQKAEEAGLIDRSNGEVKFADGVVELLAAK